MGRMDGRKDRQTERTKERRRLHPSSVPLYNILQACRLFQQRLSNISCAQRNAACDAVSFLTQRIFKAQYRVQSGFKTLSNEGSKGNNPHILNLDTRQRLSLSASRPGCFMHDSLYRGLGEEGGEVAIERCCSARSWSLSVISKFLSHHTFCRITLSVISHFLSYHTFGHITLSVISHFRSYHTCCHVK